MPHHQPHNFPTLRSKGSPNHRPSMLLLGAGMSYGLVPGPQELLTAKRAAAEARLAAASTAHELYEWADEILTQLIARGDPNPKLHLAHSLDIPAEDYWMALSTAERSAARHRVVARFAREGLWDQVWSLNWDCVQESAFENVGLARDGVDAGMPWPTLFRWFITAADCGDIAEENSVRIIKPHGCVTALVDAEEAEDNGDHARALELSGRFLITAAELAHLAPRPGEGTQQFIFATLCTKLSSLPLVVVGWSASELYLLDYMENNVAPSLHARQPLATDELSVIDIAFNNGGHTRLAGFYEMDADAAHVIVQPPALDLDSLFLWMQTLYGLDKLRTWSVAADQTALDNILIEQDRPPDNASFVTTWMDSFLPVWVRLCWRCGLVPCFDNRGQKIDSADIHLESRDEHIPWLLPNIERPELRSAARLLTALYRSADPESWDYEKFPGGLYRNQLLVVPLPCWNDTVNDLRGLKALIDALKLNGPGYIDEVSLLFLSQDAAVIPHDRKQVLKELVARDLAMIRFANAGSIGEIRLEDL